MRVILISVRWLPIFASAFPNAGDQIAFEAHVPAVSESHAPPHLSRWLTAIWVERLRVRSEDFFAQIGFRHHKGDGLSRSHAPRRRKCDVLRREPARAGEL